MEANRDWTISLLVSLATLWLWIHGPSLVHSAPQPCTLVGANCIFEKVNLSAGGFGRLRASVQDPSINQITVKRLITPYADSIVLVLLSEFVEELQYERYNERMLRILPKAMLTELRIRRAPELRTIAITAPNRKLISLDFRETALASLSDSFRNLPELKYLSLENGALETLSLDPFDASPNITSLACSGNKITQLIVSRNESLIIPIVDLLLSYNLLESIDGDFFRPLRKLKYVTFENNRIQRIEGGPISLPKLSYISFVDNQLIQLDVSQWYVPQLIEMYLENNNLTRIPVGIERHPNLITLVLQNNLLTVVDLRRLDGWAKLEKIDLTGNRVRNVLVSGTGRISLPNLVIMHLENNQLTHLDYARWNFPLLSTLSIAFNQFHQLPDLFQIFPKLKRVYAFRNPLRCSTVRRWEQYIVDFKLSVDTTGFGTSCPNGTHNLPSGRKLCCVEFY